MTFSWRCDLIPVQVSHLTWAARAGMVLSIGAVLVDLQFNLGPCIFIAGSTLLFGLTGRTLFKRFLLEG